MDQQLKHRLEQFRNNYIQVAGKPFKHFFCPILLRDDDVPLSKGHIINQDFQDVSSVWTVQRTDVDNFYGAHFESEYILFQYAENGFPADVFAREDLFKKFKPKLLVDDKPINFFIPNGPVPKEYTLLRLDDDTQTVELGLKISPQDAPQWAKQKWEAEVSNDLTLPALVSLIKAAHLTMFSMFGYRYALSGEGRFVGYDILGTFFTQNRDKPKAEIKANAQDFFSEFMHMARQIQTVEGDFTGTITDGIMYQCKTKNGSPWAHIVLVKTSSLNAVLIPFLRTEDAAARFLTFLQDDNEYIEVDLIQYTADAMKVINTAIPITWPKYD